MRSFASFVLALVGAACAGGSDQVARGFAAPPPTTAGDPATPVATAPPSATSSPPPQTPPPTVQDIFARLRPDLVACYEAGRKDAPAMKSGKITLHAEVEPAGGTTCVVPSEDTGLTQEVEDCMAARLERERYAPAAEPWSVAMPIQVRGGEVVLGSRETKVQELESVETYAMPDAFEVIESLVPALEDCLTGARAPALRVVHVGARVGADGKVGCALVTSSTQVPSSTRACLERVLERTSFPPPRRPKGLVSIPIRLGS